MLATSPAEEIDSAKTPSAEEVDEKIKMGEEHTAKEEETPAPVEVEAPVVPRKTWSMPKAPPPNSISSTKKKSFLEIQEEEAKEKQEAEKSKRKALEARLEAEEAAALAQAMAASVVSESSSSFPIGCAGAGADTGDVDSGSNEEMDEDMKLALLLSMQDQQLASSSSASAALPSTASVPPVAAAAAASMPKHENHEEDAKYDSLTEEEMKEIERALDEADAAEHAKSDAASLRLALELQNEERKAVPKKGVDQGNIRTMHRGDFLREQGKGNDFDDQYYRHHHDDDDGDYDYDDMDNNGTTEAGFRINSNKPSPWSRTDRTTIRGPNQELRTKHDPKLQGQANAYRLELRADDATGNRAHVGNKAYNAFHRSMQKKTIKGVAAHGHGRANADTDSTRDGALDGRVRLQIARAVNNGLIDQFHGVVKEGKEALVFHADRGSASEGFDVAVKVFKRFSEFRNRGQYVGGDPRYGDGANFRHAGSRQQVEQWAEKEHRNLIRAYRAMVPVPKPLWQKENVLFLRFLGEDGWPSPQLRELTIKKGSKKWTAFYEQTMEAMQRLYCDGRLVHADLSEYNMLVCPASFLKRVDEENVLWSGDEEEATGAKEVMKPDILNNSEDEKKLAAVDTKPAFVNGEVVQISATSNEDAKPTAKLVDDDDALQIVLIDFGQAVDTRHPDSDDLLRRDVTRVKEFYDKMGITTISVEAAVAYVQTKGTPLR